MKHQQASPSFLGATDTVTGSRYLLEAGGRSVLVDCGLFQGYKRSRERNRTPLPVRPAPIDAVVLTHAHLDHSGYVPALVRDGFAGPVTAADGTGMEMTFLPAGHILGAARVQVRNGSSSVRFTGDLGRTDDPLMPAALRPVHHEGPPREPQFETEPTGF